MATKSILKNVTISDKRLAHTFVDALSHTDQKYVPKELSRECRTLTENCIKDFFGKTDK